MFIYVAPDGKVQVLDNEADLKTPYKWNGYQGRAFRFSPGSEIDLSRHKPTPRGQAAAPAAPSVALTDLPGIIAAAVEAALAKQAAAKAAPPDPALKA